MTQGIYVIMDRVKEHTVSLYETPTLADAKRQYEIMLEKVPQANKKEFELWQLGTYDKLLKAEPKIELIQINTGEQAPK